MLLVGRLHRISGFSEGMVKKLVAGLALLKRVLTKFLQRFDSCAYLVLIAGTEHQDVTAASQAAGQQSHG